ncbi:MAG: universal stress protein [Nitrosopumilaceae archaeon]
MKQIICKSLNECQIIDTPIMRNILVPFDDSKHATRVFGYALTLAKTFGASMLIVAITQMIWIEVGLTESQVVKKV